MTFFTLKTPLHSRETNGRCERRAVRFEGKTRPPYDRAMLRKAVVHEGGQGGIRSTRVTKTRVDMGLARDSRGADVRFAPS
jgi:hypothetical protein